MKFLFIFLINVDGTAWEWENFEVGISGFVEWIAPIAVNDCNWCFSYIYSEWLLDARKRRRRSGSLVLHKKRRRLLPYIPSEDPARRLKQMGSLASALTALQMEFSDDLTYMPHMAPRSANQAKFETGGMQVRTRNSLSLLFPIWILVLLIGTQW